MYAQEYRPWKCYKTVMEQLGSNDIVNRVLIVYFLGMPSSRYKERLKLRQQAEDYDPNYHLKRNYHRDKYTRILISHSDLCNDELPKEADNIQYRINVLDEIDDSFESEYDKHEPRLLLCSSCSNEYKIPIYFIPL